MLTNFEVLRVPAVSFVYVMLIRRKPHRFVNSYDCREIWFDNIDAQSSVMLIYIKIICEDAKFHSTHIISS